MAGSLCADLNDYARIAFAVATKVASPAESLSYSRAACPLLLVACVEKMATHLAACGGRQPSVSCSLLARLYGRLGGGRVLGRASLADEATTRAILLEAKHESPRQSQIFLTIYSVRRADVAFAHLVVPRQEIERVKYANRVGGRV